VASGWYIGYAVQCQSFDERVRAYRAPEFPAVRVLDDIRVCPGRKEVRATLVRAIVRIQDPYRPGLVAAFLLPPEPSSAAVFGFGPLMP
jgi:hypothetical protein